MESFHPHYGIPSPKVAVIHFLLYVVKSLVGDLIMGKMTANPPFSSVLSPSSTALLHPLHLCLPYPSHFTTHFFHVFLPQYRNFDMDQSGMKQQLKDVHQIVRLVDPELMSYLEVRDSANFYFCFRWLLVRFKRELNYANTLR